MSKGIQDHCFAETAWLSNGAGSGHFRDKSNQSVKENLKLKIKKPLHSAWLGLLIHPINFLDNQVHNWFI